MRIFLFLFIFLFPSIANSQNCSVKSFKKKRDVKRIIKLINNKNYSEAKKDYFLYMHPKYQINNNMVIDHLLNFNDS